MQSSGNRLKHQTYWLHTNQSVKIRVTSKANAPLTKHTETSVEHAGLESASIQQ